MSELTAEQIVRALDCENAPVDPNDPVCLFCGADEGIYDPARPWFRVDVVEAHKPGCPWRLAREWVARQPSPSDPQDTP